MQTCTQVVGGRYRLGALLGRGGMADVYRAHDPVRDREVAVKLFRPNTELVDAARRRRHEVDVLSTVSHPGLVRVLDSAVGDDPAAPGGAFIVLELVDGPNLRTRLTHGPLSEHAVATLGVRLADTLSHVHRYGIVHRDVKPANILLPDAPDAEHRAKLTDFGIARIVDSTRMTAEGLTVGTAGYLSPEQVTSAPVGTASDVYSLGLVLIEALTGHAVYAGQGIEAALRRLRHQPELPPDVDQLLGATLAAMTALNPRDRPSAREAVRRLSAAAEESLTHEILTMGRTERAPARSRGLARHRRPARRPWQRVPRTEVGGRRRRSEAAA